MSTTTAAFPLGTDGLSTTARQILTAVRGRAGEWVTVAALTGNDLIPDVTAKTIRENLRHLADRGLLERDGATNARRYRAFDGTGAGAAWGSAVVSPPAAVVKRGPATASERVTRARILDHLSRRRMDALSIEHGLNLPRLAVQTALADLLDARAVRRRLDGLYEATP